MTSVTITIPGDCVPWARTMGGRSVKPFTPSKQAKYAAMVKATAALEMRGRKPFQGPVWVDCRFSYPWPKSMSKTKRADPAAYFKASRPDLSNLVKAMEDALNNVVFGDDAQIVALYAVKDYGDKPGVTFTVTAVGDAGSED